uniref:Copper transporter n=1 Tax=Parastrongyloides trichosuri TaxID=131310 RepID=A0A0N4ZD96_PARTI
MSFYAELSSTLTQYLLYWLFALFAFLLVIIWEAIMLYKHQSSIRRRLFTEITSIFLHRQPDRLDSNVNDNAYSEIPVAPSRSKEFVV